MRIIVFGANGQIGKAILGQLLLDYPGAEVIGCVRAQSMDSVEAALKSHLLCFNPFTDDWAKLGKADVLINCIGIIKETEALSYTMAHVGLTNLMLTHRQQLGMPKLIQISALGANSKCPSRFLSTKAMADNELLKYPNTVVVRPSIVCTPGTMLSRKLQLLNRICRFSFGVLPFPERILKTRLQPVLSQDLAALVSLLCTRMQHDRVIEAGGSEVYKVRGLIEMLPNLKSILPFPQGIFDVLFPLVSILFPSILDKEQQVLLQEDNLANTMEFENLLGRPAGSTALFWERELNS